MGSEQTLQFDWHGVPNGAQLILALPCNQALGNGAALLKIATTHHAPCRGGPPVPQGQTGVLRLVVYRHSNAQVRSMQGKAEVSTSLCSCCLCLALQGPSRAP